MSPASLVLLFKVKKQKSALHSIAVGKPFACIGMDFKEMDKNFDDNWYALVSQDYLTKRPEVYPVADRTSSTVAKCQAGLTVSTDTVSHQLSIMIKRQNFFQMYCRTLLSF